MSFIAIALLVEAPPLQTSGITPRDDKAVNPNPEDMGSGVTELEPVLLPKAMSLGKYRALLINYFHHDKFAEDRIDVAL